MKTRVYGPGKISESLFERIVHFLYPHSPEERWIYSQYSPYSYQVVVFHQHHILATVRVIEGSYTDKLPVEFAKTHTGELFKIHQPACEVGGLKIQPNLPSRLRHKVLQKVMDLAEFQVYRLNVKYAYITCKPEHVSLYDRYKFKEKARALYDSEYSVLQRTII